MRSFFVVVLAMVAIASTYPITQINNGVEKRCLTVGSRVCLPLKHEWTIQSTVRQCSKTVYVRKFEVVHDIVVALLTSLAWVGGC